MTTYKQLNTFHPSYSLSWFEQAKDLYLGGDRLMSKIANYLPMAVGEPVSNYQERTRNACYVNYYAELHDQYLSGLFSKELLVLPAGGGDCDEFYKQFSQCVNPGKSNFETLMKNFTIDLLSTGRGVLSVDFPSLKDKRPETLAEEEAMGLDRAYAMNVAPEMVVDWDTDDFGAITWVKLKRSYNKRMPVVSSEMTTIEWTIWSMTDGSASFQRYAIDVKKDKEPRPQDEVALVAEGTTSFKRLPIIVIDIPTNLNIAQKAANLCIDHLKLKSALLFSELRSLNPILVYKQGKELDGLGGVPSAAGTDEDRGNKAARVASKRGAAVIGGNDAMEYCEVSGRSFEIVNNQLKELVDEIHRINHLTASSISSTSTALHRSGASKDADNHDKTIVLEAFGQLVKGVAKMVYDCISEARNEGLDWQVHGMTGFEEIDRFQLLQEALAVQQIDVGSKQFSIENNKRIALLTVPNLSPDVVEVINGEIEASVASGSWEAAPHPDLSGFGAGGQAAGDTSGSAGAAQ
jgi:hypothetical protein